MSNTPKRNFTAKTSRPVLDTSSLYGMDEVPPITSYLATPTEPAKSAPPVPVAAEPATAGPEWVKFSTYLHPDTYLRLKQAEYWEPGFVVRQQIERAVSELLDALENANRPLPEEQLRKLVQKDKKLKP
ncbi:hypothetical protein [Hymenobacter volaticus]|uniref:Uncharacterized protein n=1 Tax=Hymenobacter volaticus TaxID=2932254 RepID=A0ABY4GH49_9BACT|nr:hypothetical protein [Hymenobacter volaticus]UOQ69769.1 hypothetical protein MUN86_29595 [Hymenobacter volaticus]